MGNLQSTEFGKSSVYKVEQTEGKIINIRHGYYKNKKGIYYNGISLNLLKKERLSFKKLKYSYAKTHLHVFYKGEIIDNANPKTFITINRKNIPEEYKNLNSVIGMDFENNTKRIYQFGKLISTILLN
jgi:hypothetical protein